MDCCGEYRAHAQAHAAYAPMAGAGGWEYAGYAALPYAHYAQYPTHHDPYRYYRYDYAHHAHYNEHVMSMDYGAYASKEARIHRALSRRDARALTPSHQIPLTHTPPLECGMGRPTYCEPQMWPHYQVGGGWGGGGGGGGANVSAAWMARSHMRHTSDCRPAKSPHMHSARQMGMQEGRSTPYSMYEESYGSGETRETGSRLRRSPESVAEARAVPRPRREPLPEPPRPLLVPLPAFQQAFGSTEIGKFSEAFSRTEQLQDDSEGFTFDAFPEWDSSASADPQWSSPPAREIKCEENF